MFGYLALGFFAAFAFGLISGGENSSSNSENSLFGFLKKKLFGDDGKLDKKESEDLKELRGLLKKKSEDLSPTEIRRIAALKARLDVDDVLSERELENLDKALNRKIKDSEDGDKEITGNDEVDRLVNLNKNKTLCILQKELKNKEGDSDYDQFKELYDSVVNCAYDKDGKELSADAYKKNFAKLLKNNSKLVDTLKDNIDKAVSGDNKDIIAKMYERMDKITDQEAKDASEQARKERVETAVINDCIEAIDNLPNTTGPIGALTDSSNQAHENVKKYFEDKGLDLDLVKSIASKQQTSNSKGNDLVNEIRNDKDIKKIVDKNVIKKLKKSNDQTSTNSNSTTNGETNTNTQTSTNTEKDEYSYEDADGKQITVKREKQDDGSYKYFKKTDDGDFEDADEQAFNTAKDKSGSSSTKANKTPKTNKNKKESIDDITSELVLNKDGYTAKDKNGNSVEFKKQKQDDGSYKYFMGDKEISGKKYDKILNAKIEKVQNAIKSMDEEDDKKEYQKATKFLKNAAKSLGKNANEFIPKEEEHNDKKYKTMVGPRGGKYYKVNSGSGWGDWNWYEGNHPWESISSFLKDKLIVERFYPKDITNYLQEHLR